MAFRKKDLSMLAYANGFTLWHYTTVDAAADVDTAGYFNDAADMLRVGDMLFANVDTDRTPAVSIVFVNAIADGFVEGTSALKASE